MAGLIQQNKIVACTGRGITKYSNNAVALIPKVVLVSQIVRKCHPSEEFDFYRSRRGRRRRRGVRDYSSFLASVFANTHVVKCLEAA